MRIPLTHERRAFPLPDDVIPPTPGASFTILDHDREITGIVLGHHMYMEYESGTSPASYKTRWLVEVLIPLNQPLEAEVDATRRTGFWPQKEYADD